MKEVKEIVIFKEDDVKVTDVRFITPHETYAMSSVTSVRKLREEPKRTGALLLCIIGVLFAAFGQNLAIHVIGAVVAFAACAVAFSQKPIFFIVIKTASGESRALTSYSSEYIDRVAGAVNDAIVARG